MKAHELARELGISQKELVNFLQQRRLTRNTAAPLAPGAIEDPTKLKPRPPIVTVLGHVDHGKTSILDAIRQTHVAAGEAGGITQRIGAYKIETADGHPVVFVDTPGHEAFTAMRARGAQVTDLVVLVVAADDGVMPQTVEAIHHARAAKVPIIVAINKVDKDNANVDRVHQQLAEQGIVTRHYGGEHECVHLSARTGKGIDDLLTTIVLSSDILELKANPDRNAIGTIVDAHLERGRGPVVKAHAQGTLEALLASLQKIEDPVVAIKIVGQGVGAVSDSDLLLAGVSSAIIVCFNLKPTPQSTAAAERAKVEVRYYDVIYKLTEDVERAAKGLREPTYRQVHEGRVEVIMPIKIPRLGIIAGSRVLEGKVSRGGWVKLFRGREQVFEGRITSLKHFKEDVREMPAGQECGVGLESYETFVPGDTMETYRLEREEI